MKKEKNIVRTYEYKVWMYTLDCKIEEINFENYRLTIAIDYADVRYKEFWTLKQAINFAYGYCEWFEMLAGYIKACL